MTESNFTQEEKIKRRNWQKIDSEATFILRESNYKGHHEALSFLKKNQTFREFELNGVTHYSVIFSLETEKDFSQLKNITTKVRKFTEIEIDGNYFHPTDLGLAFYLNASNNDMEFQNRLNSAKITNTPERIENAISILKCFANVTP